MKKSKSNVPEMYLLRRKDIAGKIDIGTGDKTIINIQKHIKKKSSRAVLHDMVGQSVKCWDEQHEQTIKHLEERVRILATIVIAYLRKYGPIRRKRP
jgi:hypothetical protein